MKKFAYWLTIVICALFISLNPLQAARLVPGTLPDNQPLQPIPSSDVTPNYSGNINSNSEVAPQTNYNNSQSNQPTTDELPSNQNGPQSLSTAGVSASTQIWLWIFSLIIAIAIAYSWYRYRSRQLKK